MMETAALVCLGLLFLILVCYFIATYIAIIHNLFYTPSWEYFIVFLMYTCSIYLFIYLVFIFDGGIL